MTTLKRRRARRRLRSARRGIPSLQRGRALRGAPHFEKIYDNTELLRNYVHGYQSFVREDFLVIAMRLWRLMTMTDRERGGFYGSQDVGWG